MHIQGNVRSSLLSFGQVFFGKMYFLEGAFRGGIEEAKDNAVLVPRTGQFRRLVDFEAKDLSFEAKVKYFKMCTRELRH